MRNRLEVARGVNLPPDIQVVVERIASEGDPALQHPHPHVLQLTKNQILLFLPLFEDALQPQPHGARLVALHPPERQVEVAGVAEFRRPVGLGVTGATNLRLDVFVVQVRQGCR